MSEIGGERREVREFPKKVGLFEAKVVAINPDAEEYTALTGRTLGDDDKTTEYLGLSQEGNVFLRLDVWLEDVRPVKEGEEADKFRLTFFLENKERENKDMTKKQYKNSVGACVWADDPNNLPEWFVKRDYRVAFVGEEDLYSFLRVWLGNLDYSKAATTLELDWKKLMKGNVSELKNQINGEWCTNVGALATIRTREKDGEVREYQSVYSRGFLPTYTMKNFRLINYADENVLARLKAKKSSDLKPHERFVLNLTGEYGCKEYYTLTDLKVYRPEDNLVASDKPMSEDGPDY